MLNINKLYQISRRLKIVFIVFGAAIVLVSTYFTNRLAKSLALEERKKMEVWAEATRQLIHADNLTEINLNLALNIVTSNTTIPVLILDEKDNVMQTNNIENDSKITPKNIQTLKSKNPPIILKFNDNSKQFVYYDDSLLIKQLYYFPYVQLGVIFVFLMISFFAFSSTKKAEQNQVWVGLSKETAHQLGTPISSLLAWVDLLKMRYENDPLLFKMAQDVNRLKIIAERFSKIGSKPDLQIVSLNETLLNAVQYMINRTSQKVKIQCSFAEDEHIFIKLNVPLFEWVIENLCKNAIDAMDGSGQINISVYNKNKDILIDVKDTGKGIEKNKFKAVFSPGFSTKKRGWGLGLSLVKRIIEEYHDGKIFVKSSEINVGTVFRIILHKD